MLVEQSCPAQRSQDMDIQTGGQLEIPATDILFLAPVENRTQPLFGDGNLGFDIDDVEKDIPVAEQWFIASGVWTVVDGKEKMGRQQHPEPGWLRFELSRQVGQSQGSLEMPCELRTEQNLMQDHQRREIMFIEDFVDGIEVFDRIGWPVKCLGGPCDKIAFQRLAGREADRAVFLNIADRQQRGLQDEGMRQGKVVIGRTKRIHHINNEPGRCGLPVWLCDVGTISVPRLSL